MVADLAAGSIDTDVDVPESLGFAAASDGSVAVAGGYDGALVVVDLDRGVTVGAPIPAHDGFVVSADLSADGQVLVTTGTDGRVSLWDLAHRARTANLLPGVANIWTNARFVDDDVAVSVTYEDGASYRFATTPDAWVAHVCRVAGRDFTAEEWDDLFGDRPYRSTCS